MNLEIQMCALCGAPFRMPILTSNKVEFIDNLCETCRDALKEAAVIVCTKCKKPIGRIEAKKLECGYIVQPAEILHVDECPRCNPNCISSKFIEVESWINNIREGKIIV